MTRKSKPQQVVVRLNAREIRQLDRMLDRGKHQSRSILAHKIIRDVLDDDAAEHGELPLDVVHS